MKKIFILSLCLLLFSGILEKGTAQSKTEEAKERLKGKKSSGADVFIDAFFLSVEFLPEFFYFTDAENRLSYNPKPYNPKSKSSYGIRDFNDDGQFGMLESQFMLDMPVNSKAMAMRNADMRWHLGYWAFRSGYSYMKEQIAPYGIHQFHVSAERKFRFTPRTDGGFFMGYRSFGLSGDRFDGFDVGIDLTAFVFNPVSIQYVYNVSVMKFGEAHQHQIMAHVHQGQFRFSTGYRSLNLLGIPFSAMVAGVGFNF